VRVINIDVHPFMNQCLARRRFAWLIGKVTNDRQVKVHAFYEPPQLGFRDRFLLHKDPDLDLVCSHAHTHSAPNSPTAKSDECVFQVDSMCEALGMQRVGWLTSHKYRGKTPVRWAELRAGEAAWLFSE